MGWSDRAERWRKNATEAQLAAVDARNAAEEAERAADFALVESLPKDGFYVPWLPFGHVVKVTKVERFRCEDSITLSYVPHVFEDERGRVLKCTGGIAETMWAGDLADTVRRARELTDEYPGAYEAPDWKGLAMVRVVRDAETNKIRTVRGTPQTPLKVHAHGCKRAKAGKAKHMPRRKDPWNKHWLEAETEGTEHWPSLVAPTAKCCTAPR